MGGGMGGIERQLEGLNLTEEQRKQIEPILQDMRDQVRKATEQAREKVNGVLTEEQRTKLREAMPDRGPMGFDPVERMEKAVNALDLSADQKTKLDGIFAKFRPEFEAVRKDNGGDRQAMMTSMRPLLQDLRSQVTAVLTPEQTQKLQDQMGAGREGDGWRAGDQAERPANGRERPNRDRGNKNAEHEPRD
jgi:Spy/CpxP family protein refolding chaperone